MTTAPFAAPVPRERLPFPYRPEAEVVHTLAARAAAGLDWPAVVAAARPWVEGVRAHPADDIFIAAVADHNFFARPYLPHANGKPQVY